MATITDSIGHQMPRVGVGCIVVRGDGQILMVQNHRGFWSTPGGHLDFGESPADCAVRETFEETGIHVTAVEFVAVTNDVLPNASRHYITIWMRADAAELTPVIRDQAEIAAAGWFAPNALPQPQHLYFQNLVTGRCLPPKPANLPFEVSAILREAERLRRPGGRLPHGGARRPQLNSAVRRLRHRTMIRPATKADEDDIWSIFHAVVEAGDTYAFDPQMPREEALEYWCRADNHTHVAEGENEQIVGTYILRPNQPALGAHVANAAFMVSPAARGSGVGRQMGEHSLVEARRLGFRAMQFNLVVSTNTAAVRLWQQLGFRIVGTLPGAFRHARLGFVDACVMFKTLE